VIQLLSFLSLRSVLTSVSYAIVLSIRAVGLVLLSLLETILRECLNFLFFTAHVVLAVDYS